MEVYIISPANGVSKQSSIVNLPVGAKTKRLMFEITYNSYIDKCFFSVYDVQTSTSIVLLVPVICSGENLNNLLGPYKHKEIGDLVCVNVVDNPSTPNPTLNNWSEFALVWGDGLVG